jgi:pyrimidine-specific ribonucleoside hydrolase
MDLTYRCAVDTGWLATLAASGPVGAALRALTPDYLEHYRLALGWEGIVLHDAVAVAEAINPGILRTESYPIDVDCTSGPARGATLLDRRRPAMRSQSDTDEAESSEVQVAVDTDLDGLRSFVLDRLIQG